jgi:hypothetical protein
VFFKTAWLFWGELEKQVYPSFPRSMLKPFFERETTKLKFNTSQLRRDSCFVPKAFEALNLSNIKQ